MVAWLTNNAGTILIALLILALLLLIVHNLLKKGGCAGCPMADTCPKRRKKS